ncbi:MAG: class I SAM-dependent methyltransferase, partial [Myxococcota bacterium]
MSARTLNLTPELHQYLLTVGVREAPELAALREETASLEQAGMQISPEQGALMQQLVWLTGARRIVEVGTFTGYSALAMALALPSDGHLVCCDVSEEWTAIGRRHWAAAGMGDRITLHLGPAVQTLDRLLADGAAGTYDLAFIDADKTSYAA